MPFKKIITSDGRPIIIGSNAGEDDKFPPGFSYRIGSMIYTVKENITQEASSPMREVSLSDGKTEIMTVASIRRDLKESNCEILPPDKRFTKKEEIVEKTKKKVVKKKKKTKKKVTKKKIKKKDKK